MTTFTFHIIDHNKTMMILALLSCVTYILYAFRFHIIECKKTHSQPMMILALLPFAIGFESTRVATSVSLMRFTSLSSFIQVDSFSTLSMMVMIS